MYGTQDLWFILCLFLMLFVCVFFFHFHIIEHGALDQCLTQGGVSPTADHAADRVAGLVDLVVDLTADHADLVDLTADLGDQ